MTMTRARSGSSPPVLFGAAVGLLVPGRAGAPVPAYARGVAGGVTNGYVAVAVLP